MLEWFIRCEIYLILSSLAAMVGYRLLTGRINTRGLLTDGKGGRIAATKVQMLVATGVAVSAYLQQMAAANLADQGLPEPSATLLAALGGSQLVHLGGLVVSAAGGLRWPNAEASKNSGKEVRDE